MRLAKLSLFASFLYVGVAVAQPAPAQAPAPAPTAAAATVYSVVPSKSLVIFHIVHKLHKVDGESRKIDGKARLLPDGKAQVGLRIDADSFDTKNVNRDSTVKEVVEAGRHPKVEVKAAADGITPPASLPWSIDKTFKAQIKFHGIEKTVDLPVKLTFEADGSVRAQGKVSLSLDEFKVERPSLLLVKIDDALQVDANIVFQKG